MLFGVLATVVLHCWRAKKYNLTTVQAITFSVVMASVGFLGSKGLYILEHLPGSLNSNFTIAGQSFYGLLFLVAICSVLLGHFWGLKVDERTDICAPPLALFMVFLRIGCMTAGCCAGIYLGNFQVPTQLIEAIANAGLLSLLLYYEAVDKWRGIRYPGFMLLYGSFRFFIEFFRASEADICGLSKGQWLSLAAIFVGIVWIARVRRRKK